MYWKVYLTFVNKVSALLINTQELWVNLTVCFWLASGINVPYMKYLPVQYLDDVGTYNVCLREDVNKGNRRRLHAGKYNVQDLCKKTNKQTNKPKGENTGRYVTFSILRKTALQSSFTRIILNHWVREESNLSKLSSSRSTAVIVLIHY